MNEQKESYTIPHLTGDFFYRNTKDDPRFKDTLIELMEMDLPQTAIAELKKCKTLFDLGSGRGNSVNLGTQLAENIQIVHTVDIHNESSRILNDRHKHHSHHKQMIGDFLNNPPGKADLISLIAVPEHQLAKNNGYNSCTKHWNKMDLY